MSKTCCLVFMLLTFVAAEAHASILVNGKAVVVSGDTLTVAGVPFEFRDAEAFELDQDCTSKLGDIQCGTAAKNALEALVTGVDVVCGSPGGERDGRMPAVCFTKAGDLAIEMIHSGWAFARPDLSEGQGRAYQLCFNEGEARKSQSGAWRYTFVLPYVHRGEIGLARETASCGNVPATSP